MQDSKVVNSGILNALTFDVEEWFQTILFNKDNREARISSLPKNILEILDILEKYKTKATFFILGIVAEKNAGLVKIIHSKGHEIASHGYLHRLVYKLPRHEFRDDVKRSLDILRGITNSGIIGYRAPTWSISKNTKWAIDVLRDSGLQYDSSIYPISRNLFLCKKLNCSPYVIREDFIEFPPPTFKFLGYNLPFAGGTFLRFFSKDFINSKIRQINNEGSPILAYFHSWEFDADLPRINISAWKHSIQCTNLSSVKIKLISLLQEFKFSSVKEVLLNNQLIGQNKYV